MGRVRPAGLLAGPVLAPRARIRRTEVKLVSASELEMQIGEHPPGSHVSPAPAPTHGRCQARRDVPDFRLDTRVEMLIGRPQTSLSDRRVAHLSDGDKATSRLGPDDARPRKSKIMVRFSKDGSLTLGTQRGPVVSAVLFPPSRAVEDQVGGAGTVGQRLAVCATAQPEYFPTRTDNHVHSPCEAGAGLADRPPIAVFGHLAGSIAHGRYPRTMPAATSRTSIPQNLRPGPATASLPRSSKTWCVYSSGHPSYEGPPLGERGGTRQSLTVSRSVGRQSRKRLTPPD